LPTSIGLPGSSPIVSRPRSSTALDVTCEQDDRAALVSYLEDFERDHG